jgi:hypothetical protein
MGYAGSSYKISGTSTEEFPVKKKIFLSPPKKIPLEKAPDNRKSSKKSSPTQSNQFRHFATNINEFYHFYLQKFLKIIKNHIKFFMTFELKAKKNTQKLSLKRKVYFDMKNCPIVFLNQPNPSQTKAI